MRFYQWIKAQKRREDIVGRVASDLVMDECLPRDASVSDTLVHIAEEHGALTIFQDALLQAVKEWIDENPRAAFVETNVDGEYEIVGDLVTLPAQKVGFTLDEYKGIGLELAAVRDRLVSLSVKIANSHGNSREPVVLHAFKMTKEIDEVRNLLDSEVFRKFPDLTTNELVEVNYPDPDDREKFWKPVEIVCSHGQRMWRQEYGLICIDCGEVLARPRKKVAK